MISLIPVFTYLLRISGDIENIRTMYNEMGILDERSSGPQDELFCFPVSLTASF